MSETAKIGPSHLRRPAVVYVRQSSASQVERNTESTARQYGLASRAVELGWPASAVRVIDDDLGLSGASAAGRSGFAELAAQVGLGQVGIVLALEVSRLARNNVDWYRLLDLAGMTDTLIADSDGVYHPAMFNDRLLLGMKGAMSEAELHILRARLDGGIRNKAARGELRKALPVGLVWGEAEGEILLHPDEAVRGAIAAIFEQFPLRGSARGVWLWLREQGLKLPLQKIAYVKPDEELTWVEPTYTAVHNILTHPAYAGAYVFGKTRHERYVDRGRRGPHPSARLPPGRVAGADPWPPPGLHRLGDLPGQPGPHRGQHPAPGAPARHRGAARRLRPPARPRHLRDMRPQARRLLRRARQVHPGLLLRHRETGERTGRLPHARGRPGCPRSSHRGLPGRLGAGGAAGVPGRRRATGVTT